MKNLLNRISGLFTPMLMVFVFSLFACTESLDIDTEHEPILQVDAVFYADELLPIIEIKQSFEAIGTRLYEIPLSDLLISGAEVSLTWNGRPIAVIEESGGKYRGLSTDIISQGDVFEIEVIHEGRHVKSRAEVPVYNLKALTFTSEEPAIFTTESVLTRDSIPDTVNVMIATPIIRATVPFIPDFMAFEWYALEDNEFQERFFIGNFSGQDGLLGFRNFFQKSNFSGFDSLVLYQELFTYFEVESNVAPTIDTLHLGYEIVIPEPIYAAFHNTESSVIVPITITNVSGGVGLFIGAIRETKALEVLIEIAP